MIGQDGEERTGGRSIKEEGMRRRKEKMGTGEKINRTERGRGIGGEEKLQWNENREKEK